MLTMGASGEDDSREHARARRDRIIDAAVSMLRDGDCLLDLGLTRKDVAENAGVSPGTVDHHGGMAQVRREVARRVQQHFEEVATKSRRDFDTLAAAVKDAGDTRPKVLAMFGRTFVQRSLLQSFEAYENIDYRAFLLFVALADKQASDVNYAEVLRDLHRQRYEAFESLYGLLCDLTAREYEVDKDRTIRAIDAYLDGVLLQQRYEPKLRDVGEIADTVIRLFWATTKPVLGEAHPIDRDIFSLA
jgi:hypothetical protein